MPSRLPVVVRTVSEEGMGGKGGGGEDASR